MTVGGGGGATGGGGGGPTPPKTQCCYEEGVMVVVGVEAGVLRGRDALVVGLAPERDVEALAAS